MEELVRRPQSGWGRVDLGEVWRFRDLLLLLVWRNTIVRYKQSLVGVGWAVVKPVVTMVVFTLVFGKLLGLATDGSPGPIFYFSGLLPWLYFTGSLMGASSSLVSGSNLATKVYFPRLVLPLSYLFAGLVDLAISLAVLGGMMVWYRDAVTLSWGILCVPLFVGVAMLTAFAFSLWFSALMVRYRDVEHVLPFVVQIWMYACPLVYPLERVAGALPKGWFFVYCLNPMVGVVSGFRWATVGSTAPAWGAMGLGVACALLVLAGGLVVFRRAERFLVDVV